MADVDGLLAALTLEEKAALTAGQDMFSTVAVERLGIPKVTVTDGPSGARGRSYPGLGGPPATCIPCGSAIGATWDPSLAEHLGKVVGREALDRGCLGLLAPTVNLHRHPLAGRNFECYSEDPLLSGSLAVGYVRGVQSAGVFATVKHFVGNEAEFERYSISSVIDERSLRELYLLPFEMAVREAAPLAIMTSYNRLNGRWLTERPEMLTGLLRGEWGFRGLVMTDWFAAVNPTESLAAGLDLEMPGPGRVLGSRLMPSVEQGLVDKGHLDAAVGHLLTALDSIGALDRPEPPVRPGPPDAGTLDLLRHCAAEATVMLTNDGVLPLDAEGLRTVAVLGALAQRACMVGGGSAAVAPHRPASPLESLREALPASVTVVFERGCEVERTPALVGGPVLRAPRGFEVEVFEGDSLQGDVAVRRHIEELRLAVLGSLVPDKFPDGAWSARIAGTMVPDEDGTYQLALAQSGRARLLVDGRVVLDGWENPPPPGGTDFFGQASQDLVTEVRLRAGVPVEIVVEYARSGAGMPGVRLGFRTPDADGLLDRAEEAARHAGAAVVFVGTTGEWESEGSDRPTFALPGRQDELVRRVAAVNPRTVVVVNAAAPVDMPWTDEVSAVLQCWFGGQEMDRAVADVLVGRREPGGRLPVTIPARLEHSPSHDNFPGENGELRYGEGLFVGYRGYDHRCVEPRFPFGHGLGYTTFEWGEPILSSTTFRPGEALSVSVPVTNTGSRPGSEVVQCYVAPVSPRLARPPKELKAFAKLRLEPGQTARAELLLGDRAFAYWDPGQSDAGEIRARLPGVALGSFMHTGERRAPGWQVDPGSYDLLIGTSASDAGHRVRIEIPPP